MISSLLKYPIIVEKGTMALNSVGSPELVWSEYISTYAGVYVVSNDTRINSDGQQFVFRTEFTIRYNEKTKVINNKYRIKYNDTYYKIMQIPPPLGVRDDIKLITVAFDGN